MTDTELLDGLEKLDGCWLISSDNGHWAVSSSGIQNLPPDNNPFDFSGTAFVETKDWKPSIREAIAYAIKEASDDRN